METILSEGLAKILRRQILIQLLEERRSEFHKLIVKAIKEAALARAPRKLAEQRD